MIFITPGTGVRTVVMIFITPGTGVRPLTIPALSYLSLIGRWKISIDFFFQNSI